MGLIILSLFLIFAAVVLVRTAAFQPKREDVIQAEPLSFDQDAAIKALAELVRCRTVSSYNPEEEDDAEFQKLVDKLPGLYPHVYETCTLQTFPGRALLFHWKGKSSEGDPAVLMAHYDVVPVDEASWEKPAFSAIIEDGVMWGRGTLDTKVTFNGVLSAAEHLIGTGFVPEHDIYFAFSGGEEVNGPGAGSIVTYFQEQGITPAFVIDEGGAVMENVFPGVSQKAALIGTAEKGMINLEYKVKSSGGHASSPAPQTPVGILSAACAKVEAHPFPMKLSAPAASMFDTLGRHSSFLYRMIFANFWCFSWVLGLVAKKSGGTMNALLRTTVAFTQMEGSSAPNVIPPVAKMVSNIRVNPEESVDSVIARIKSIINDDRVEITPTYADEPSRISTTDCEGWKKISHAAAATWQGAIVAPYLMTQCSDSKYYGVISDKVYRFSCMDLTMEEVELIHGHNERIRLEVIGRAVEFYIRLMKQC